VNCPHLPDFDIACPISVDAAFANSPAILFSQSWLLQGQPGLAAGSVRIGWHGDQFCFDAQLQDAGLFTSAKHRNEMLYELGDTLEFFAGAAGANSYVEYHYAPNGVILQLLWPTNARSLDIPSMGGVQAFAIEDNQSTSAVLPFRGGWRVCAKVKFPDLSNASGTLEGREIDLNFGRYDYADAETPPVLSSTSVLPRCCFHDRQNWRLVVCEEPQSA